MEKYDEAKVFIDFVRRNNNMKCYEIIFSPTGGTQKAADLLTHGLGGASATVDLTDYGADVSATTFTPEDVAVIAVPSYAGRVPGPAVERLGALKGNGARAVLVCVYGNRAYEDTLVELEDTARQTGFHITAAVATIAEHSIVRRFAAGRPDAEDEKELQGFAEQIRAKLSAGDGTEPALPGNRPYKKAGGSGMAPKPTKDCTGCGLCGAKCPVQAIDRQDPSRTDKDKCISCMRCVAVCPQSAREIDPTVLAALDAKLSQVCRDRKTGELYL